jgi:SAM-dependent methyltransferase
LDGPVEAADRRWYARPVALSTGREHGHRAATAGWPVAMTRPEPPRRIPAAITGAGLRAAGRAWRPTGWTGQNLRHVAGMIRQGRNPAARVYESIGSECFLALAPGWLNLGLWEGPGTEAEAEAACRRLIQTVASALPAGGVIVDVGNGLGTQDPLIAESVAPRRLVAVNVAEWQLAAGRDRLREAAAAPVAGDAARLPLADQVADGLISVEAAFHFRSRRAFFAECYRVLRPGGVLSITDISTERWPRTPAELASGLAQLRVFGLRPGAAMTAGQIAAAARAAGMVDVEVTRCGDRVIAPALRVIAARLSGSPSAPLGHHAAARIMLWQVELLWRHRIIDYLLLRATRPG